jgi:hypothetical protein
VARRAEELRTVADGLHSADNKRIALRLAEDYARRAEKVEPQPQERRSFEPSDLSLLPRLSLK